MSEVGRAKATRRSRAGTKAGGTNRKDLTGEEATYHRQAGTWGWLAVRVAVGGVAVPHGEPVGRVGTQRRNDRAADVGTDQVMSGVAVQRVEWTEASRLGRAATNFSASVIF